MERKERREAETGGGKRAEGTGVDTMTCTPSTEPGPCPAMSQAPHQCDLIRFLRSEWTCLWDLSKPQAEHAGENEAARGHRLEVRAQRMTPRPPGTATGCAEPLLSSRAFSPGSTLLSGPLPENPAARASHGLSPISRPRATGWLCPVPPAAARGLPIGPRSALWGSPHVPFSRSTAPRGLLSSLKPFLRAYVRGWLF